MQFQLLSLLLALVTPFSGAETRFEDDFQDGLSRWKPHFTEGDWSCSGGILATRGGEEYAGRAADIPPLSDVVMEVDARCGESPRRNFGLALRVKADHTRVVIRYYDRDDALQIIFYEKDAPVRIESGNGGLGIQPGAWYRFKAAAVDDLVLAKCWPAGGEEPDWQVRAQYPDTEPGLVALAAHDGTHADFRSVRVDWGEDVDELRQHLEAEHKAFLAHMSEGLTLEIEPTPLVFRDDQTRLVLLRTMLDGNATPVNGMVHVDYEGAPREYAVKTSDYTADGWPLRVAEPAAPVLLHVGFDTEPGKRLEAQFQLEPAKQWTFYMTPHTHYDIGYTEPQPEVIERLAHETNDAIQFCEDTADWPAESRYRWTLEVTSLADHFIKQYPQQVDRLMKLVHEGRIEICGFYLNMPTELTGHEETIRCLYYAQELRERYGVRIDTVMLDDVPGYTWALADLLVDAGMPRAAFRANSIRGQFLWYREGAVPRPFYWEGPAGKRLFTWYTDSYREGNFFREPGLYEDHFLGIIRQNEATGTSVTDIQLRMGGDNLPPDLDASANARAWNDKYLWPRVTVATNREFLEVLEAKYGAQAPVVRGDIPSWWAEGPASTAAETGIARLAHDRLLAVEALWTLATLWAPDTAYPRGRIRQAYDYMIHFDEHTWGASGSISDPHGEATRVQWQWKASQAYQATALTEELEKEVLGLLAARIPASPENLAAVWNATSTPGNGLVALKRADGFPVSAETTRIVSAETGGASPAQWEPETETLFFAASNVPAYGFSVYRLETGSAPQRKDVADDHVLENESYRLAFSPETGAWVSFQDKRTGRELLDATSAWRGNQPIREIPNGGREAIDKKQPVDFERTPAGPCRLAGRRSGPVYDSLTFETALPGCPRIRQTYRLCGEVLDIENIFQKDEVIEPEAISLAFPFAISSPVIHVEVADAVMRPGVEQLPYSCYDFYSIQHWAAIGDNEVSILWSPIDALLVSFSDLNMYRWADKLTFDRGHVYSLVMNNCWTTNFRAGQDGEIRFRYRVQVLPTPIRATDAFAWSQRAFSPLLPLRPAGAEAVIPPMTGQFIAQTDGEPVAVTCVKRAESSDDVIVRLLELDGRAGPRRLRFDVPRGLRLKEAYTATPAETRVAPIAVQGDTLVVDVPARGVVTIGMVLERNT